MLRLQGMHPTCIKNQHEETQRGKQRGKSMSVNVLGRILCRALGAAGLGKFPDIQDRWGSGKALKTVSGINSEVPASNSREQAGVDLPKGENITPVRTCGDEGEEPPALVGDSENGMKPSEVEKVVDEVLKEADKVDDIWRPCVEHNIFIHFPKDPNRPVS